MFIVIRKSNIILLACITLISFYTFSLWLNRAEPAEEAIATFAASTSGRVIVIDAGHGGIDDGASGGGAAEKDINIAVALKLQEFIEQSGGIAILTRYDDRGTFDPNRPEGMTQRRSDLLERVRDRDESDADMFVSIHMNTFADSRYSGAQVFYSEAHEDSQALAVSIKEGIAFSVGESNPREVKPVTTQIFVLKNSTVPAVLVECGFLSNPAEAAKLQTEEHQRALAWGIFSGIIRYLNHL